MQPVRTSTRERKAPKHFDEKYVKKQLLSTHDAIKEERIPVKSEEPSPSPRARESSDEPDPPYVAYRPRVPSKQKSKSPKPVSARKPQEFYTPDESLALMQFFLSEIHSKTEGREGRVAKRRVEISNPDFWERCKRAVGSNRNVSSLRSHYHFNCRKLHEFEGLTLEEKVDLYYAMDIKVDKSIRKRLVDNFAVEFDKFGIITGSAIINHWDLVHPDSEPEEGEDGGRSKNWSRFTELDDGLMWQFIVDGINTDTAPEVYGKKVWAEFQKKNRAQVGSRRANETFRGRYHRILLPNLHKMPFDVETKAALYQTLQYSVPESYRETLINETGVTIDEDGIVTRYPNRPKFLVLQSKTYEDIIGITSANKLSTLKHPYTRATDPVPYTEEEDHEIWQYMRQKAWQNGKMTRFKDKMSGWVFWKQFLSEVPTNRTWQSLSQHFTEDLMYNIMDTQYDLKIKMELFFALSIPVDEDTLAQFETIAHVMLRRNNTIWYAVAQNFLVGRKERAEDYYSSDDEASPFDYDYRFVQAPTDLIPCAEHRPKLTNSNLVSFMDQVAQQQADAREAHRRHIEALSNSVKFPYLPLPARNRKRRREIACEPGWVKKDHVLHESNLAGSSSSSASASDGPPQEKKPSSLLGEKDVKEEPIDEHEKESPRQMPHRVPGLIRATNPAPPVPHRLVNQYGHSMPRKLNLLPVKTVPEQFVPKKPPHMLINMTQHANELKERRLRIHEERLLQSGLIRHPLMKRATMIHSRPMPSRQVVREDPSMPSTSSQSSSSTLAEKEIKPEPIDDDYEMATPKREETTTRRSIERPQTGVTVRKVLINPYRTTTTKPIIPCTTKTQPRPLPQLPPLPEKEKEIKYEKELHLVQPEEARQKKPIPPSYGAVPCDWRRTCNQMEDQIHLFKQQLRTDIPSIQAMSSVEHVELIHRINTLADILRFPADF